ncbi:glycosyltransferase family 4 protein [Vibrio crassostreae]|uniref:glycosyltransferase family 4 protein n=1 Tax=Vibrio crassostreae TaxID=246167 RepID=UPI00104445AB|nr:glycosyltransferase family 4 protein [Vibrio crassostreae]TCW16955.1 glycosyltransferase involved in cell wall biosynthesis [Vibrio crassostreae]CAK3667101.1 putative Glycosyltransferase family 1 protein [Vibrio crassostreae]
MKLLYICDEINTKSGWATNTFNLVKEAKRKGHTVTVLTSRNVNNTLPSSDIQVFQLLRSMKGGPKRIVNACIDTNNIKKIIDLKSYDAIHITVEPLMLIALFIKHPNIILSLIGTYSDVLFTVGVNQWFYKLALKKMNKLTAISDYTAKIFREKTKSDLGLSVSVIPLGVDLDKFSSDKLYEKKSCSFVFVGHIKERKGLHVAIKALHTVKNTYPKVRLIVVGSIGDEKYYDKCIELITKLDLKSSVDFKGNVLDIDLKSYYEESLACILPSINAGQSFEGFGLVHLEANASGIPSIGSLECGNETAISHGISGYLARQNSNEDVAKYMNTIISSWTNNEYQGLQLSARNFALEHTWELCFNKMADLYEK